MQDYNWPDPGSGPANDLSAHSAHSSSHKVRRGGLPAGPWPTGSCCSWPGSTIPRSLTWGLRLNAKMWSKAFLEDPRPPSCLRASTSWPRPRLLSVPLSLPHLRRLCTTPRTPPGLSRTKGINYKIYAGSGGRAKAAAGGLGHRGEAVNGRVWAPAPNRG